MEPSDFPGRVARMSDVARVAGVARVTVSRVLNNVGVVSDKRKTAVLSAAESLGYRRNFNAGVLAGGRAFVVGALVCSMKDAKVADAIGLLSDALTRRGFHLFVAQSHGSSVIENQLLAGYLERRVSAIVFLGPEQPDHRIFASQRADQPIVEFWDLQNGSAQADVSRLVKLLG